jgi:diaminohydroxyphosphoribosylaminopyrimidine deaminase/5-amino-6-(5-phosphoribosylamino)uracil reductase
MIRALSSGAQTTVAEVSDYALSKDGAWLVYAVSSKTAAHDGSSRWITSGDARADGHRLRAWADAVIVGAEL